MPPLIVAAFALALIATGPSAEITGTVPKELGAASSIVWMDADEARLDVRCALEPPRAWKCAGLSSASRGVVVLVGDQAIAFSPIGVGDADARGSIGSWGRLVRVIPGGVIPDDLHDLRLTSWKPDRSSVRLQSQRFVPVEDAAVHVLRLSNTAFWLWGVKADIDSYVRLEGPAIASTRVPTTMLIDGAAELPFFAAAAAPFSLRGRVQAADGQDVEDTDVELFEPLRNADDFVDPRRDAKDPVPLLRRGRTTTHADGSFTFDGLAPGRYEIVAAHPSFGRGSARIERLGDSVTVKLVPPARAIGRVLQRGSAAVGVRIRFMPDTAAWVTSTDPALHIAVEASTGTDGRFVLMLPPEPIGSIQIIAPDGAAMRLALAGRKAAGDIMFGDVVLPERRRLTVLLLDASTCDVIAVGPIGVLGLAIVHATTNGSGAYWFELPEPGRWSLNADCAGKSYSLDPAIVVVPSDGPEQTINARLRTGGDP